MLRIFISKNRIVQIVHLHRQWLRIQLVLNQRAHRPCCSLRLERDGALTLILKGIHFFLDNVSGITHTPLKQLCILKHRRTNLPVAGQCRLLTHDALNPLPKVAFLWQHIAGAFGALYLHCILLKKRAHAVARDELHRVATLLAPCAGASLAPYRGKRLFSQETPGCHASGYPERLSAGAALSVKAPYASSHQRPMYYIHTIGRLSNAISYKRV